MKPIDIMLDRVEWTCTKCGAKQGTCSCWIKVTLRCPFCHKEKQTCSDPSDPKGTAIVECSCPECAKDYEIKYFAASGAEINQ